MITNTATAYGSVAKTFHWLIALMMLTVIPLGVVAYQLPYDTDEMLTLKATLFSMHKTLGILIFAVALLRILWAVTQPKPCHIHPDRRAETFLAGVVHWILYGSLVLMPLTGWIHHAATEGFAPIWLPVGQNLPLVPESESLAKTMAALHKIFGYVLGGSILLHIAGALKHAVIDRDGTLDRMWFGHRDAGRGQQDPRSLSAPVAAVVIWIAALGIGAGAGLFAADSRAGQVPQLAAVASDWEVQDGSLAISITQLGSPVAGAFADWTAAISFDPDTGTGDVSVTVAIGSLTLGSVTGQALGPDFFDATTFPTATFTATIRPEGDGYVAEGPLTIKGTEIAAALPFTLALEGDTATVSGALQVDRRDFSIGMSTNEGNLGFPVDITVALTATR